MFSYSWPLWTQPPTVDKAKLCHRSNSGTSAIYARIADTASCPNLYSAQVTALHVPRDDDTVHIYAFREEAAPLHQPQFAHEQSHQVLVWKKNNSE